MFRRTVGRSVHTSWLIAFACVGIVLGVVGAQYPAMSPFGSIAWLLTGIALFAFSMSKACIWVIPIIIVAGASIGLWRGMTIVALSDGVDEKIGGTAQLRGVVSEDTDINQRGQSIIRLRDASIDGTAIGGSVWLTVDRTDKIQRSDVVTASGIVSDGFGSFVASMHSGVVKTVERPVPGDVALTVRNWFADGVRTAIAEPHASLGLGYLVGQRRGLPEDLDTALQAAGLTHIVVASGYNLTILVRFARRLFEHISKYLSLMSSGAMIAGFIAVTGMSPSMSRAGLVAGLSLLAWYYGRRFHPLVLLPFAMAVTLLVQPSFGWGDVGWQLSFAAFAGVMILAPLLQAYFFGDTKEKMLRRIFIETISAQIFTLPILLVTFGQLSAVAPVANILILPLVPLAMVLTFVAGLGSVIAPPLASFVGMPAELLLTYMTNTAQFMGRLPWATQDIPIIPIVAVTMYGAIILASVFMWRATRLKLEQTSLIE